MTGVMPCASVLKPHPAASGPSRVAQYIHSGDGTNFDHSYAFTGLTIAANSLIIVKMSTPQTGAIVTAPSDGNTWAIATAATAGGNTQSYLYCLAAVASSAHTITLAFNNGCSEYGISLEIYSAGTWTFNSANSGTVIGSFSSSPSVTPSLSPTGAGVIGVVWGQYQYPFAANTATISPGTVINSGGDGTTIVMASGEEIFTAGFSGTITCNMNQSPANATKIDITYCTFNYAP